VATEEVGRGKFLRHSLLTGIDERSLRPHPLNLGEVAGLNGITEHDSHVGGFRRVTANLASVFSISKVC
jgi:hypothetical protein